MAIYLEFEGAKDNGTAEGYKDHIAVDSATFSARRTISMEPVMTKLREVKLSLLDWETRYVLESPFKRDGQTKSYRGRI